MCIIIVNKNWCVRKLEKKLMNYIEKKVKNIPDDITMIKIGLFDFFDFESDTCEYLKESIQNKFNKNVKIHFL